MRCTFTGLKRALSPASLMVSLALLGACDRDDLSFTDDFADYEVAVVGAGSVRIGTDVYVLAGIDVPRPAPEARCWAEALLAREARMALDGLVRTSGRVHTQGDRPLPSGEVAALVEVNGEDLSAALVNAGFAVRSNGTRFDWCSAIDPTITDTPELGYEAAFLPNDTSTVSKVD